MDAVISSFVLMVLTVLVTAFVTYQKTKKDNLWRGRFDCLTKLIHFAEIIRYSCGFTDMEHEGVRASILSERSTRDDRVMEALQGLNVEVVKVRVLFKCKDSNRLIHSVDKLGVSVPIMFHTGESVDTKEVVQLIGEIFNSAIKLSKRYIQ